MQIPDSAYNTSGNPPHSHIQQSVLAKLGLKTSAVQSYIYAEYRIPGGYHHDQFELEDGNILVLTQDLSRGTVEDVCVLIDRETGAVKKSWDYTSEHRACIGYHTDNHLDLFYCANNRCLKS